MLSCSQELTTAVRKELAVALRDLLQHGLMEVGQSSSLVPFGCFSTRRSQPAQAPRMMHAWDLFTRYYEMKVQSGRFDTELWCALTLNCRSAFARRSYC